MSHKRTAGNAPSGIAQLRKSSEHNILVSDPMNLDDFIVAENITTPGGTAGSPSPELVKRGEDKPARTHITAIPIKHRQASLPHFVPQSVPVPAHAPNVQHEFGYITRHHRKTSIDERRVSYLSQVQNDRMGFAFHAPSSICDLPASPFDHS